MTSQADREPDAAPAPPRASDSADEQSLGRLFMEHWDRLHRMVEMRLDRRLHGRVNPSDVLQESYLEVVRSMPGYLSNPKIPFFQWLRHITGVKLMALHRKHLGTKVRDAGREVHLGGFRPQTSSVTLAARLLGRLTSPSEAAARAELQLRVQEALNGLDPIDREVLSLRHFEQLTNTETARLLGVSEAAASNRYVRALKRLRPILLTGPDLLGDLSGCAGRGTPMTDPDLRRNPVEILAEEFLERYRRGERPSVTEYVNRHPELSGEIREVFPALLAIEGASPHPAALGAPRHTSTHADDVLPDRLGDFRIIGEIGRGGMGVVYEAIQESLGRHVALKVLPVGALTHPAALKRFHREARSVAALHHSNIVPVFGIGEQGGHHYYAMQLIHGQTLEAVLGGVRRLRDLTGPLPALPLSTAQRAATEIAGCLLTGRFAHSSAHGEGEKTTEPTGSTGPIDRPVNVSGTAPDAGITTVTIAERGESQYHRRIARIGLQVAEALGYAHDQGVLHRDIKPSNLLMDDEGTVWVLDFGLAKAVGVAEQSASRNIVGTLRYMAPERFDSRSDRRSDVYGLGITLYELLTLRPAFDAGQQSALIHQILQATPTSPRQIDRRIPRNLETIVLKAMAKEPSARYASGHALGDDLRRFLENRTILARRSTSLERTSRWCRRNPVVAALLTSVVALLAFIAAYYSVSATRYRHQFERAHAAEVNGRDKLFTSYLAQARASRFSRRPASGSRPSAP